MAKLNPLVGHDTKLWNTLDDATKWCVHYCVMHNVDSTLLYRVSKLAIPEPKVSYILTEKPGLDKFTGLAEKLRDLWPSGMRTINGKEYSWRDSVPNLRNRLRTVWKLRNLDKYTDEDVLQCARRYLSRFEDDKKYMKSVKYFILKADGKEGMKQVHSILADMLEGTVAEDNQNEWAELVGPYEGGELV